ncbi:MAG: MBL fold metallo-hydrolase, partial [Dehalococcoidia bacterium]|nr:MBL fold metallo-hydrolase [Dehalococcoidia bacterium]
FREELRLERLSFDDIRWIVVTHIHPDHFGLAAKLKEVCGAKVVMHQLEAALIDARYTNYRQLAAQLEAMLVSFGVPVDEATQMKEASAWAGKYVAPVHPDILVDEGDTVSNGTFQLDVIHTPGHSAGHICLYEARKRRLFTGDHVVFDAVPEVGVHPQSGADPMGDYLESLDHVGDRPVSFVFPGHGPVFNSLGIRSEEIRREHAARRQQVLGVLEDGVKTVYEVARELDWSSDGRHVEYEGLSFRARRAGVCGTAAWLKRLVHEGEVAAFERDGMTTYMEK